MLTTAQNTTNLCPDCGAPVPPASPGDLCPRCLALAAVGTFSLSSIDALSKRRFFGDYELLEELGRGGSGIVFKARQLGVNRIVAIKLLSGGAAAGNDFVHRFHTEAAATARLENSNIVAIYEFGEHEGAHFLTMRYLEGGTLQTRIAREKLTPQRSACLLIPVAAAIEYAHRHGVLHRDLKPGNILLDSAETPYVSDFGLARFTEHDSSLTLSHAVLGTISYLSPEVATSGATASTTASDIYGLGAILYEMLTGRPPFEAETIAATVRKIADQEPVPLRKQSPSIPPDLETICLKCLAKDPAKRYPRAQALVDDLQRFLNNEPITARPISAVGKLHRWSQRNPALATAYSFLILLLLVILIASPLAIYRIDSERRRAEAAAKNEATERLRAAAEATRATSNELEALRSNYAADMFLAEKLIAEENRGAAVQLLNRYLPNDSSTNGSPDLRGWEWHYLATATREQSLAVLRDHDTAVVALDFSGDGRWIASCGLGPSVRIWDARTKSLVTRLSVTDGTDVEEVFALAFSPDGKYLAAGCDLQRKIHFWEVPAWKKSFVLTNLYRVTGLAFSPNAHYLAAGSNGGSGNGLALWDLLSQTLLLERPLTGSWFPWAIAFSADSKVLVYDADGRGELARLDLETLQDLPPVALSSRNIPRVLFTADGKLAATCAPFNDTATTVWSLPEWRQSYRLTNELLIAVSSQLDQIVTTGRQELHLWRLGTGELLSAQVGHTGLTFSGAISPSDPLIATGSTDKTVRLWSLHPPAPTNLTLHLPATEQPIQASINWQRPRLSSTGSFVVTVQTNRLISLYSTAPLTFLPNYPWGVRQLSSVDPASNGEVIAVGGQDGELNLLDCRSGAILARKQYSTNQIRHLRFSPDGSLLAVAYQNMHTFEYWLEILRTTNLTVYQTLVSEGGTIFSAAFTPDNRYFLFGSYSSLAQLVDLHSGRVLCTFRGRPGRITSVALTPDARFVATHAEVESVVRLWDGHNGREINEFRGTWERFNTIALSPDGVRLAAGGVGVDMWDLLTGRHIQTLRTENHSVWALAWSFEMTRFVTVSSKAIRLWPADTFPPLTPPK